MESHTSGGLINDCLALKLITRRLEMNRRTFLATTPGAVTLATTLSASAQSQSRDRKKVLIPQWEPEQIEDLRSAVPEVELVVAKDSLEQVRDVDASFGFINAAHIRAGKKLRWVQQGSAGVEGVVTIPELIERDIVLTNMQRILAPEIADQAIAYLLAFTRGLTHFIRKPRRARGETLRTSSLRSFRGRRC
jgi:phosphoglycerate dehydrogenase-like enzyme